MAQQNINMCADEQRGFGNSVHIHDNNACCFLTIIITEILLLAGRVHGQGEGHSSVCRCGDVIMHQSARIRQTDRVLMELSLGCQNPHSLYCQTPLLISIIRDRFHCQSPSLLNPLQSPLDIYFIVRPLTFHEKRYISLSDPIHNSHDKKHISQSHHHLDKFTHDDFVSLHVISFNYINITKCYS